MAVDPTGKKDDEKTPFKNLDKLEASIPADIAAFAAKKARESGRPVTEVWDLFCGTMQSPSVEEELNQRLGIVDRLRKSAPPAPQGFDDPLYRAKKSLADGIEIRQMTSLDQALSGNTNPRQQSNIPSREELMYLEWKEDREERRREAKEEREERRKQRLEEERARREEEREKREFELLRARGQLPPGAPQPDIANDPKMQELSRQIAERDAQIQALVDAQAARDAKDEKDAEKAERKAESLAQEERYKAFAKTLSEEFTKMGAGLKTTMDAIQLKVDKGLGVEGLKASVGTLKEAVSLINEFKKGSKELGAEMGLPADQVDRAIDDTGATAWGDQAEKLCTNIIKVMEKAYQLAQQTGVAGKAGNKPVPPPQQQAPAQIPAASEPEPVEFEPVAEPAPAPEPASKPVPPPPQPPSAESAKSADKPVEQ